ncbi:MAG: hypothetical protein V3S55_09480 [Nitrospiraceae bacterium]
MPITAAAERGELRRLLGGVTVVSKTANYTALSTDEVIACDAIAGAMTITLPPVASNPGLALRIKKTDSSANAVTVDGDGDDLIDRALTAVLTTQDESIDVVCNGTSWGIH